MLRRSSAFLLVVAAAFILAACPAKVKTPTDLAKEAFAEGLAGLNGNLSDTLELLKGSSAEVNGPAVMRSLKDGAAKVLGLAAMLNQYPELLENDAAALKSFLPELAGGGQKVDQILSLMKKNDVLNPAKMTSSMRYDLTSALSDLTTASAMFKQKLPANVQNPIGQFLGL